ncbi:MAG: hypothetical protein K1X53_13910 [Candidatus Sumerlaeaceae bacterium]|nr:hypothetical protein [Candidatus Sumerlaeaceae bacterium]
MNLIPAKIAQPTRLILIVAGWQLAQRPAGAQFSGITVSQGGKVPDEYVTYAIIAVSALVLFWIAMILLAKIRRNRDSTTIPMTVGDINSLKTKGLLTEEETKAVKAAVSRQVAKQYESQHAPKGKPLKPEMLLADPDVQRLEMLAQEKQAGKPGTPSPTRDQATQPSPLDTLDDLPPEVAKLAASGLITPEELERIRQRMRDQQSGL